MAQISEAKIPETQRTEEGRLFEKEFDTVLGGEKKDYPCYIGGLKEGSRSGPATCSTCAARSTSRSATAPSRSPRPAP